ncbi:hypothetical protein DYB32_003343 [Aphanomyces invadans]|uniref:Uncharacterized protein n=1 Tax=Aphanomyces invadans TaxID=157072 RepID=A0A418B0W7_9STRA|nr:hypothetical protein DYB32_003343 [Aphanomyces invadans]
MAACVLPNRPYNADKAYIVVPCRHFSHTVSHATFIDPIVFFLWKHDVAYNFLYRRPTTGIQVLLWYFASTEVHIVHVMRRHFWWYNIVCFPEHLPRDPVTSHAAASVFLSSHDLIINANDVHGHLATGGDVEVVWWDGFTHGEMLLHPHALTTVTSHVKCRSVMTKPLQHVAKWTGAAYIANRLDLAVAPAFVSKIPRRSVKLPTPINALPVQLAATESSQPDEAPSSNNQQESATPPKVFTVLAVLGTIHVVFDLDGQAAVVDKHQQYIKDLEEKKRKAREEEVAKAEKQRRLRLKLRKSILQRAASIRTETDAGGHDTVDSTRSPQDESEAPSPAADDVLTDEERKAKAAAQKRLLQKQQVYRTSSLKVKRQKEAEAAEAERQRAQKKKELTRKASLGTTQEAIKKKQVEYLQKLADERKQKQLEEDEKNELLRQKRAKVREEALLKHEAAKAEKAAAAAAAEESATPVVVEADEVRPKVFCMTGWYPVIKDTLEKRGWFHNPDRNSPYFDLKWALKSDDLKNVKLHDDQSYIQDFRYIRAEGMLKRLGVQCRAMLNAIKPSVVSVNLGVLDVVLSVCRKRQEILPDDVLDNPNACGSSMSLSIDPVVTDLQWDVLQRCPVDAPGSIRPACVFTKPSVAASSEFGDQPPPHLSPSEAKEEAKAAKRHEKLMGMSRGRGIRVFNQLNELLEYADVENHKECQWIVQKYIENPLLVCNRKFDIRQVRAIDYCAGMTGRLVQWVFVTSWNPLTVWFYLDCYLRFSSEEYQVDDLTDQYVHLTNNSIQKNGENFYKAYTTEDGSITIEGNMLHSDDLSAYLTRKYGLDPDTNETIFTSKIQPRMKEIVKWSLSCVQDTVQHRKNSCELYGYDFMLDETFKVNSSPACDYSTAVTKRYIETGLEDILKVMLDVREYDAAKRKNSMAKMPKPDTGRWENIHKAEYIAKPMSSFGGMDFEIKGKKLSKKSQRAINQACALTPTRPTLAAVDEVPESNADEGLPRVDADLGQHAIDDTFVAMTTSPSERSPAKFNLDDDYDDDDRPDRSVSASPPSVLPPELDELL